MKIAKVFFLLFAVFIVLLLSLSKEYWAGLLPREVSLISGQRMLQNFSKYKSNENLELKRDLIQIVAKLKPADSNTDYSVSIISSAPYSETALSLPGGIILVGSDFVRRAESVNEVTAILAHEMAHLELRHAEKGFVAKLSRFAIYKRFGRLIFSYDQAVQELAAGIFEYLLFRKEDPAMEMEADFYAANLLRLKGYDASDLLRALDNLQKNKSGYFPVDLSSRIAALKNFLVEPSELK